MISEREATLTFTNAAPQYPGFNKGYWKEIEEIVKHSLAKPDHCGPENAYFVTGVAPGAEDKNHRYLTGEGAQENPEKVIFISEIYYYEIVIFYKYSVFKSHNNLTH